MDQGRISKPEAVEYVVEKILNKRTVEGKKQYFLKWKGFNERWEPEENIGCPEMVNAFEAQWEENEKREKEERPVPGSSDKNEASSSKSPKNSKEASPKVLNGLYLGLEAEKIDGAIYKFNELMFRVKWYGTDQRDLVPSRIAKVKWPQQVIKFYQERLVWVTGDDDVEEE